MLLRLDHIAVFQANWNDKATNIQAIAEELSLGLDAMVFLDDNPVERGLVRKLLPQVRSLSFPRSPPTMPGPSPPPAISKPLPSPRGPQACRLLPGQRPPRRVAEAGGGVDAYLKSLDMTIIFQPSMPPARPHRPAHQ